MHALNSSESTGLFLNLQLCASNCDMTLADLGELLMLHPQLHLGFKFPVHPSDPPLDLACGLQMYESPNS